MALKQCSLCDRKFTKLEHVKRHERSHTRERPYECPTCKKHFSRSDVLFRHCKGHAQNAMNRINNSQNNSNQTPQTLVQNGSDEKMNPPPIPQSQEAPQLENPNGLPNGRLPQDPNLSPLSRRPSSREVSQINPEATQHRLPSPSITVRQALSQHPSPNDSRLEALINAAQTLDPPGDVTWRSPSPINMSADNDRFLHRHQESMGPPIDPAMEMLSFSPSGHVSSLDQWAFELVQSNHPLPNRTPADALQTWLFPLDNDLMSQSTPHHHHMTFNNNFEDGFRTNLPHPDQSSPSGSNASIASRIPRERFARVENCWPARSRKPARLMPSLWKDLVTNDTTNLLCEPQAGQTLTPMSERERRNSRWGFDDECRDLLQGALNSVPSVPTPPRTTESYGDTASSTGDAGQSPGGDGVVFPPAEILDIALEMYLYHFHPTLPIVHIPTFSAKTASRPLLLVMCLLGLSILGTAGASKFISRTFPTVLHMVSTELQGISTGRHPPEKQMRILATALLTLNLASITGRKTRIGQSEKLYTDLLTFAQSHGLFSSNEGQLPDELIDNIMDIDTRWKAWSRVECTKRILMGLLEVDCWYSAYLSISPTVRPETVQIIPPADHALFNANSATKWFQLAQRGIRLHAGRITPSYLPPPGMKLESSSLRSLLTMHLLRIYDANDRLVNPGDRGVQKILEPWRVLSEDPRSRDLIPLLVSLSSSGVDVLRTADLNSSILWHASCMLLGCNMRFFELAAGRSGPGPAVAALDDISAWAQTPAARRSILHAAHIFKLLFDRKVSDIVTSYSVVALFQAALVLGLYVFTLPQNQPTNPDVGVELLELVDWTQVGHIGLVETPSSPGGQLGFASEGPVINFIRNGGPFSITGVALEGGYLAARRTLLHCADVMDGMGRWKSRTFSQILHIMSDDLTDVDMVDSDEQ